MKQSLILIALVILLLIPVFSYAVSEAGLVYLLMEPGSRSGGMGQAYVAQVDDAFAGYWNTGAMAFNRSTQFALMHSNWLGDVFDDIYYEYFGFNTYLEDTGNIGFNVMFLTYGEQDAYDEDANFLKSFSSWEVAPSITYGYQLNKYLGVGGAFKFIHSDLAPEGTGATEEGLKGQGSTFAFDFGINLKDLPWSLSDIFYVFFPNLLLIRDLSLPNIPDLPGSSMSLGLNIQNLGPNIVYINEEQSDPIPLNWRMGFSWQMWETEISRLTFNADMNKLLANRDHVWYERIYRDWVDQPLDEEWADIIWGTGGEFSYLNLLSLRLGYIYDRVGEIEGISYGAGLFYEQDKFRVDVDFAMQPGGDLQDFNRTFSIKVSF
ncbi:MAG: PorV/PorQ family protein [Candidatus Stygibacter australis]|nr:PorV/PorQ family protein [Candidatus Stygibacter australis]MDP8322771.1 PorV/PorQ family protein [Candidatus Stygibacter australis]